MLTAISSRGNATTTLAIDIADVLLQGCVWSAARATGDRAVCVLRRGGGSDEGNEG
jgi:hypothetical protein